MEEVDGSNPSRSTNPLFKHLPSLVVLRANRPWKHRLSVASVDPTSTRAALSATITDLMTRYSAGAAAMLLAAAVASAADWSSPFDGKTLNGWKAEGAAAWNVEKGELVGRQGPGGAGGDLFTVQQWRDFELEAEWTMHFPGNSGIWFRVTAPGPATRRISSMSPAIPVCSPARSIAWGRRSSRKIATHRR